MREIRLSGSKGRGVGTTGSSYPCSRGTVLVHVARTIPGQVGGRSVLRAARIIPRRSGFGRLESEAISIPTRLSATISVYGESRELTGGTEISSENSVGILLLVLSWILPIARLFTHVFCQDTIHYFGDLEAAGIWPRHPTAF